MGVCRDHRGDRPDNEALERADGGGRVLWLKWTAARAKSEAAGASKNVADKENIHVGFRWGSLRSEMPGSDINPRLLTPFYTKGGTLRAFSGFSNDAR